MKRINLNFLLSLMVSVLMLLSCDDDVEEASVYIGDYTIKKATLTETVIIPVVGETEMDFPLSVGFDITEMIQEALLNAITDCSADASLIELRKDYSLFMSCSSSDFSINAGTWEEKENGTVLILNFNSTAIPSSPTGFSLTVTDIKLEDDILSSNTAVPIPKEVVAELIAAIGQGAVLSESAPDIFLFTFDMELKKVK